MTDLQILEQIVAISRIAGADVMAVYGTPFLVDSKSDLSPVTAADRLSEERIVQALKLLTPSIPIAAEESFSAGLACVDWSRDDAFWLVDPLDGTREFVSRNGEFTVNIALIRGGAPVLGVVFAPALGQLYAGLVGAGAFVEAVGPRQRIRCRVPPARGLTVLTSRSHDDQTALRAHLSDTPVDSIVGVGSSIKFCRLAEGAADCYPRLGRTMEWDTAAGHAVLLAAGGQVQRMADGVALGYGKPGFENPAFVARGAVPAA